MSTLTERQLIPNETKLNVIRGFPILDFYDNKVIEAVMDFSPDNDDVILCSYPKTGSTWTQYIVHQILTKGDSPPAVNDAIYTVVPYLELAGIEAVEKLTTRPRFYRHNIPYNLTKKNLNAKIIYVYRKPEDTLVSYYYFTNELLGYRFAELDDFVKDFLSGNVDCGQYFDHIRSFCKHKGDGNILFVSYEKLLANRKQEILRMAKFLGPEYFDHLTQNESTMNKIMEHTDFSYMKKNLSVDLPKYINDLEAEGQVFRRVEFFRKGTSGEGKKILKEDQLSRLMELAEEKLEGTDILAEWLSK